MAMETSSIQIRRYTFDELIEQSHAAMQIAAQTVAELERMLLLGSDDDDHNDIVDEDDILSQFNTRHCVADDEEEEETDNCCICLERLHHGLVATLHCRHEFHAHCIRRWLCRALNFCPLCKATALRSPN